jgi:hypothetical protein
MVMIFCLGHQLMGFTMIRQVKTKNTTLPGIIRSAPFMQGFAEVKAGKPLNPDAFPDDINKQWSYERGRQFSYLFDGPLKKGRAVNFGAVVFFGQAIASKAIM